MQFHRYLLLIATLAAPILGQTIDPLWDGPAQLSSLEAEVVDKTLVVDRNGQAHAFWIEERPEARNFRLNYARREETGWSAPMEIEVLNGAFPGAMTRVDVKVDLENTLHLAWNANWTPIHYRSAPADQALDLASWTAETRVDVVAYQSELLVGPARELALVYCPLPSTDPAADRGVYAVRSLDLGAAWSEPVQIDPDIPNDWSVQELDAATNGSVLHLAWSYVAPGGYQVRRLVYARSLDWGGAWSQPFTLDEAPPDDTDAIRLATPTIAARGDSVEILWAGGPPLGVGRRHRSSSDAGVTWTDPTEPFGDLHGRAETDSAIYDSTGALHYFAQIRWPQAVYHAVYAHGIWTTPRAIYSIASDFQEAIGDRIHAHNLIADVSADDHVTLLLESCGACPDSADRNSRIAFSMETVAPIESGGDLTSVSSADFAPNRPLAPEAIASAFGAALTPGIAAAVSTPLPTELDGVQVQIVDRQEHSSFARLFFVSPGQINYLVPGDVSPGAARVRVRRDGQYVAGGVIEIAASAPALYTADASGTGVAAAAVLRVALDGTRTQQLIFDPVTGGGEPVSLDPAEGEVFLLLYGTGVRGAGQGVTATVGGLSVPVLSAVAQGEFDGLDQINLGPLPPALSGAGDVEVQLFADGVAANVVSLLVQ